MYTQGQAVLNRGFFPCFDTPAVKCTYSALIEVRAGGWDLPWGWKCNSVLVNHDVHPGKTPPLQKSHLCQIPSAQCK